MALKSGIAWLYKPLANRWNMGVSCIWKLPPGNTELKQKSLEGINYIQSFLLTTDKKQNKEILEAGKSVGALPLTSQKAKFSARQDLSRAQFHLCADSPARCLPQLQQHFQAPGQSQALAAWHLEKLWDAESNCMVLPWPPNQLPFRFAKAQFSYVLTISYWNWKYQT